jgi:hypothetical protein
MRAMQWTGNDIDGFRAEIDNVTYTIRREGDTPAVHLERRIRGNPITKTWTCITVDVAKAVAVHEWYIEFCKPEYAAEYAFER